MKSKLKYVYCRWVEQDPKEILSSVYHCMEQTLHSCKDLKINPADIKGKYASVFNSIHLFPMIKVHKIKKKC